LQPGRFPPKGSSTLRCGANVVAAAADREVKQGRRRSVALHPYITRSARARAAHYEGDERLHHGRQRQPVVPSQVEWLARWLDVAFRVPGLNLRFGLDALVGLIPGVGDAATSLLSLYILAAAQRLSVPRITLVRMGLNILIDAAVGAIPLVGDMFDVYWKANQKNAELLRQHLAASPERQRALNRNDRWFVIALVACLSAMVIASAVIAWYVGRWFVSLASQWF
jgi:hypothetical protein